MATTAAPKVTRVVPEDGPPFIIGMIVLFAAIIPFLFGLAWYYSPLEHVSPAVHGPTAPAAAPAAEPAAAPAAEAEAGE
jgi:hypothetical protein